MDRIYVSYTWHVRGLATDLNYSHEHRLELRSHAKPLNFWIIDWEFRSDYKVKQTCTMERSTLHTKKNSLPFRIEQKQQPQQQVWTLTPFNGFFSVAKRVDQIHSIFPRAFCYEFLWK